MPGAKAGSSCSCLRNRVTTKCSLRTSRQVTVPLLQAWIGQSRRHDPVCLSVVVLSYIAGYPPFFFEGGRASTTTAMTLVRPLRCG